MLKSKIASLTGIAAAALLASGTPASALTNAESTAFDTQINEARSKMMGQSAAALEHARAAGKIARGGNSKAKHARLTASWLEAEALMRLNRSHEASPILQTTLKEVEKSFKGSVLHADLLRSSGSLNVRLGQFADAMPDFDQARDLYENLGKHRSQAIVLINIGSLYSGARQFDQALSYFEQGQKAFSSDPALALSAHNNIGIALQGLGRFSEAQSAFGRALETPQAKASPLLTARILTNIAATQVADGRPEDAKTTALAAMKLADEHAPDWARFVDGVLAQVELANGDLEKAQTHIESAFADQNLDTTTGNFREFHETAVKIYMRAEKQALCDLHEAALARLNAQVTQLKT